MNPVTCILATRAEYAQWFRDEEGRTDLAKLIASRECMTADDYPLQIYFGTEHLCTMIGPGRVFVSRDPNGWKNAPNVEIRGVEP